MGSNGTNGSGGQGGLARRERSLMATLAKASRYPITPAQRKQWLEVAQEALSRCKTPRETASMMRVLDQMEEDDDATR